MRLFLGSASGIMAYFAYGAWYVALTAPIDFKHIGTKGIAVTGGILGTLCVAMMVTGIYLTVTEKKES